MNPLLLLGLSGALAWSAKERFYNRVQRDARALGTVIPPRGASPTNLPDRVRRYVERCVPRTDRIPAVVRLVQRGEMRLKTDGRWIPFHATQDIGTGQVGFVWHAQLYMGGVLRTDAVDSYVRGDGRLEGRVLGIVPMAKAAGPDIARAQALRYLAEIPWAPHAAYANPEIAWRMLPDGAAEVGLTGSDRTASLRVDFNDDDEIVRVSGKRPRYEHGRARELPWVGELSDYSTMQDLRIPMRAEVRWNGSPTFEYFRCRIVDIKLR